MPFLRRTAAAAFVLALFALTPRYPTAVAARGAESRNPWRSACIDAAAAQAPAPSFALGRAERVAAGIDLFRLNDPSLLSPPGPIQVQMLRLDPRRVLVRSALALDQVLGRETVDDMAKRAGAIAAINAGFFLPSGDPAGLLKISGELVSDTKLLRGVVGITSRRGAGTSLVFDRASAVVRLRVGGPNGTPIALDGVDTARAAGALVWFTPRFFAHTDTRDSGTELVFRGSPLRLEEIRNAAMRTSIPRDGAVLSFGGTALPQQLAAIRHGAVVAVEPTFTTETLPTAAIADATDVVGGAGLLLRGGRVVTDWTAERLGKAFDTQRHPRTMIGVDAKGRIWLVTIDGRNEGVSLGMSFQEMQRLAVKLGLIDALNLDGGGSTTMVVRGRIANRPSDSTGPRKVSDALLVFPAR